MKHVLGLFRNAEDASDALHKFLEMGYDKDDVTVIAREGSVEIKDVEHRQVGPTAASGAKTGAWTGGIVGLVAGIGAIALPGVGPILAAGPILALLTSTVAGAGIGAAAGGLIGALVGLGVREEDAHVYAEGVKRGGVILGVDAKEDDAASVFNVMQSAGAVDIAAQRARWQEEGWNQFEESQTTREHAHTPFSR